MGRYKVNVTEPAEADIRAIAKYIAVELNAPVASEKLISAIKTSVAGLSDMPERYPPVTAGYRKIIIKNYIILYTVDDKNKTVNVERVLHSKQNWLKILQ